MGGALFCGPDLWSPLAGPFARLDERACPAGGYFSMKKSRQKIFGARVWSPGGGAEILQGAKPVRLPGGGLLLYARVVAGCAPCRVTQPTLGVTLQRSAAPPFPGGPCVPPGAPYQNTLGAVPQDPLTLKLRLDTNDVNIVRTAPQIRSQGACGAFLCRDCR